MARMVRTAKQTQTELHLLVAQFSNHKISLQSRIQALAPMKQYLHYHFVTDIIIEVQIGCTWSLGCIDNLFY